MAAVSLLFCLIAAIFLCVRGRPRVVKEETGKRTSQSLPLDGSRGDACWWAQRKFDNEV